MAADYQVHTISVGYSRPTEAGMEANCSCTLVRGPKTIIVDTMTAWDGPFILSKLSELNVKPEDIDYVISSHGHSDHIGNNNLFLNALHIVGFSVSRKDIYFDHDFSAGQSYVIDDLVQVVPTPGHTMADVTVVVASQKGIYGIVGDLFEKKEDIWDESVWLEAGSEAPQLQRENRLKMIRQCDWIVPGHGEMFQVDEDMRKALC